MRNGAPPLAETPRLKRTLRCKYCAPAKPPGNPNQIIDGTALRASREPAEDALTPQLRFGAITPSPTAAQACLDRCIDLADHRVSVSAVGKFPGNDVFSSVLILADNGNGTSHAPKAIGRGPMVCIPLRPEHHRRVLASLLVEGLRVCAVPFRFVEHLDFFTPANHHRVLGGPFAVFPSGESGVGVWRSGNDGLAHDQHDCCWHGDDHGYAPSSSLA
jgi:hypothetical protein